MSPDQIFQACNSIAMLNWILLIVLPNWKWTSRITVGVTVTLFALIYVFFVFQSISFGELQSFGSLEGVLQLFSKKEAVLVGWVHYLAFDLMVGRFIVNDAAKNQINRFLIIPCLLFTFMLGPTGLLLYLLLRFALRKKYFVDFD